MSKPSAVTSIQKTEQGISVSGSLVFATVSSVIEQSKDAIGEHQGDSLQIDCSELKRIDSAGISLLLEWQRQSLKNNIKCQLHGLSEQAKSLLKAYHLESFIDA